MEDSRLDELLANRYERTLKILDNCPNAKMTLALTGQTKELVAREFPRTYRMIISAMKKNRIELTQCPYSHPQPVLLPRSSMIEQIRMDLEVTMKYYSVSPGVFWSPECAWSPCLPELLNEFGATSIYLRQLPTKYPVWLKGTNGGRIVGFNLGQRPSWNAKTGAGKIRRDFEKIERQLLKSEKKYAFMMVFADDIEMSGIEEEALLHERIFDVAAGLPYVKPVLLGSFLKKHPPETEMEFTRISCWINHFRWWAGDIVDIHQNSLAEEIRRNLSRADILVKKIPARKRAPLADLRRKGLDNLVLLESTEPKGWRPSLDRRLWGYRHSEKGLVYSRNLVEKCIAEIAPKRTPHEILVPLIESKGIIRTDGPVEFPLPFESSKFFGNGRLELNGKPIEYQLTDIHRHQDGSISNCALLFNADAAPNSVQFAKFIPVEGGPPRRAALPSSNKVTLSSEKLNATIDLSKGGRIQGLSFNSEEFLTKGEYINTLYLTPTKTFERTSDCAPAELTEFEDGPIFSQAAIRQCIINGIDKLQRIRLYKKVPWLMVRTELIFSHPAELGVYQPWKQNKSDKDLIIGDIRLKGRAGAATTLPCSPNLIQTEQLDGEILKYIILANDWTALSTHEKTIGLVAEGAQSKFDIARLKLEDGYTHLGYCAGSPSQFGPHYNDERHGYWSNNHRFVLYYIPAPAGEYEYIQQQSLIINHPLFFPA